MSYLLAIFFIIACIIVSIPVAVLFHELGHAIPMVLLTKQPVTVYIGSYGSTSKSLRFKIGSITFYWHYYPYYKGLCVPAAKSAPVNRQLIYVITGPLASLLVSVIGFTVLIIWELDGMPQFLVVIFIVFNLIGFLNVFPQSRTIHLADGRVTHNDGTKIMQLLQYKRLPSKCKHAYDLYNAQRYEEAADELQKIVNGPDRNDQYCRLLFYAHLLSKDYRAALYIAGVYMREENMSSDDFVNVGIACSFTMQHERAIGLYDKSLALNPNNKFALNNKGYSLNVCNKYLEAIPFLDDAILIDPQFAHPYNNKGLAQVKLGQLEKGLKNIQHSLELDSSNAYAYRNLGIYYMETGGHEEALKLFEKAKELDSSVEALDALLAETKLRLVKEI